jgi:hypothetical protein
MLPSCIMMHTYGGYQLVNVGTGVDFGYGNANRGYAADLDEARFG